MGVVNNLKEALDIEEIVKVFIIEQRILNLISLEKKRNFENVVDSDIMISATNDIQYPENSNKKILQIKNDEENSPVFNVRGLI